MIKFYINKLKLGIKASNYKFPFETTSPFFSFDSFPTLK